MSQLKESRPNDKLIGQAYLNPKSNLLALSFINTKLFYIVDLAQTDKIDWCLPVLQDLGVPLAITGDIDKLVVAYDTNKIAIFDLLNKQLHPWTVKNIKGFPRNFLNRYNRFVGATQINENKFLIYTNYTYCVLDLLAEMPEEVEMVQNHPTRSVDGKQLHA